MLWDFTDVLGVLLPLRQPTVGVGRSRCGGHDVAGTADERVAGVVEAHHRQQGGSGSPDAGGRFARGWRIDEVRGATMAFGTGDCARPTRWTRPRPRTPSARRIW